MFRKQSTRRGRSIGLRAIGAALFGLALSSAEAQTFRFSLASRELLEERLRQYGGKNAERGATLKRMFAEAGCGEHLSEQPVKYSRQRSDASAQLRLKRKPRAYEC